jgi:hypothetical protein
MQIKTLLCSIVFAVSAGPVWAHHGWSSYDADKTIKVETAVLDVQYRNPHAELDIDYQGARWDVILAPTRRMESRGLQKDALTVGKSVIIEGYPRRDGTHEIRAERITVDGKTIELR